MGFMVTGTFSVEHIPSYLQSMQPLVENGLRAALELGEGCPARLNEAMAYSLLAPGKRLRPMLVFMAAEVCGTSPSMAVPAACAVEMVHAYSLIHDDLPAMDDDDLRRGLPSCHKKYGEALAILAGDALLTLAFQVLADGFRPRVAAECCRELALGAGAAGMVGGQVEDLAWEKKGGNVDALIRLHGRKTGALFRAGLRMGALAASDSWPAEPDAAAMAALDGYGRCFGLAFQITDDLLDVQGSADQTGKSVGKDAGRGKLTYPGLLGVEESRRRALALEAEASKHLDHFGGAADRLRALFRFVLERDR